MFHCYSVIQYHYHITYNVINYDFTYNDITYYDFTYNDITYNDFTYNEIIYNAI